MLSAATKDYKGILGIPSTFDDKGDVARRRIFVYQVKGAGFEQVKTIVVEVAARRSDATGPAADGAPRDARVSEGLRRAARRPRA